MIFAQRDGRYLSAPTGMKFGDFLAHGCHGIQPVFGDWADHLTTLFTDARLKQHIELRSADCVGPAHTLALQALWKGLFYDAETLDEALSLAPKLELREMRELQERVARSALDARFEKIKVLSLAKEIIRLSRIGLERIAPSEAAYLDVLHEQIIVDEVCPADILLRNWHGSWNHSMERVVEYLRVA